MKKNILLITSALEYFDSSASNRNRLLVDALSKYCNVFSIEFTGKSCEKLFVSKVISSKRIVVPGFRTNFINPKDAKSKDKSFFNDLICSVPLKKTMRIFVPDLFFIMLHRIDLSPVLNTFNVDFDFVITSSDPKGIHTLCIDKSFANSKFLNSAKFSQYWGDPLYNDINLSFSKNIIYWLIEKWLFSKSDKVFFVSNETFKEKSILFKKLKDKFEYLPRPIDTDCIFPKVSPLSIDSGRNVSCSYIGDYYSSSRNITPLVDTFRSLKTYNLKIAGNTDLNIDVISTVNVSITSRVPDYQAKIILEESDVCIVLLNKSGTQLPGKLFDLIVTNKIIIVIYEFPEQVDSIPFKSRLILCENTISDITAALLSIPYCKLSHPVDEYEVGRTVLKKIFEDDSH